MDEPPDKDVGHEETSVLDGVCLDVVMHRRTGSGKGVFPFHGAVTGERRFV